MVNGSGAEIGHMRADFDQRFNCNCAETVASATGVVNLVNFYYPKLTFKSSILQLIKDNKVTAKAVLMLKLVINSVFLSQKSCKLYWLFM